MILHEQEVQARKLCAAYRQGELAQPQFLHRLEALGYNEHEALAIQAMIEDELGENG